MEDQDLTFNPFDASETQHLWGKMAEMRARCPVVHLADGFTFLSRFEDVRTGFRDTRRFTSAEGFRAAGVQVPLEESFLGELDPPEHTNVRRVMQRAFSPAMTERARAYARTYADRRLGELAAQGGGDLVAALALPLPVAVAAHTLGTPEEDIEQLSAWSFELIHSTWPATNETERGVGIGGAFPEFAEYLDAQIAARRAQGGEPTDLLGTLVSLSQGGEGLSDLQIRTMAVNVVTGSISTTNLIGNLLHRALTDPGFDAELRADRSKVPAAVEESLRHEPPVLFLFRTVKEATTLGGEELEQGRRVILGIASANRDEDVYPDAEEYRLDRGLPENLAFGSGAHLCLGNNVARMEAAVVLEAFLDAFAPGQVRLADGYQLSYMPMFLEYGPDELPVVVSEPA